MLSWKKTTKPKKVKKTPPTEFIELDKIIKFLKTLKSPKTYPPTSYFKQEDLSLSSVEYRRLLDKLYLDGYLDIYRNPPSMGTSNDTYIINIKGITFGGYVKDWEEKRKEKKIRKRIDRSVLMTNTLGVRMALASAILLLVQLIIAFLEYHKEPDVIVKPIIIQQEQNKQKKQSEIMPPFFYNE
jgi:hypothetical protein